MDKAKKKRGLWSGLLRIFVGIGLGLLALVLFAVIQFWVTKQAAWDFLPQKYQVYLQIPNLRTVLDDWMNLDAAKVVLGQSPELAGLEKTLLDLKALKLTDDPWIKELLGVEVHAVVLPSGQPLLVFDLGWRSVATRWLPAFSGWLRIKNLSLLEKDGLRIYQYELGKNSLANILFKDNLALVTLDQDLLFEALAWRADNLSLSVRPRDEVLDEFSRDGSGSLRFLADPRALLSQGLTDEALTAKLVPALDWKKEALVGVDLDNQRLRVNIRTSLESEQPILKKLLAHRSGSLSVLRSLPESTYLFSSLNLGNFEDLADTFAFLSGTDVRALIKQADDYAKPLLGMDLQQLLFGWAQSEAGAALLESSPDPVFYVAIKDEGALNRTLEKLRSALAVTTDSSLVLDGVRVPRLKIPDFLQDILAVFGLTMPSPYYQVVDGVFYLCLNPEALAKIVNDTRKGRLLAKTPAFQSLTAGQTLDPALFLYYDLDRAVPFFLKSRGVLPEVLKLYNRGLVALHNDQGKIDLQLYAQKLPRAGTAELPGFPLPLTDGLAGPVSLLRLPGAQEVRAYYQNKAGQWLSRSLSGGETWTTAVLDGTELLDGLWNGEVAAWSPRGALYRWQNSGKLAAGFPLQHPWQDSFKPILWAGQWVGLDGERQKLVSLDDQGRTEVWDTEFPAPVKAAPVVWDGKLAVTTKAFDGTVLLLDERGLIQPGWPVTGGGLAMSGAVVFPGQVSSLALLVQKGQLNLWDAQGQSRPGFPVQLEGVYFAPPLVVKDGERRLLACLSQTGVLSLVQEDGSLRRQISWEGKISGREARLSAFDLDKDGSDEIFVWGDKNTIEGLNLDLQSLPGFPVAGSQQPAFLDLNLDGTIDVVAGSFDGKIHAWTWRK